MKWEKVKLGDLFQIKHGWAFKGEYFSNEGELIIVTPGNFFEKGGFRQLAGKEKFYLGEFPNEFLLKKNDVIIAMTEQGPGLLGSPAIVPSDEKYLHNQRIGLIHEIKNDKIDPMYIYRLFFTSNVRNEIFGSATGTKVKHTAPKRIYDIDVNLPSLPTQRKIASILSAYDDLIENNLKRIKLLEEKAQLHYKELMQGSAKWDKVRLEEFVTVVKGRKPSSVFDQPEDDSQLYLLLDTVERGKTLYTSDLTLPQSKITDVLMCMDGARSGLSFRGMVGAIGSTMAIWRSNSEKVSGEFLYQFMKQNESAITQGNTGAAIPHANRKFILDMKMVMPPKKEAGYFDGLMLPMIQLINTLYNQNAKLREARDILLPRLMNGQIEV